MRTCASATAYFRFFCYSEGIVAVGGKRLQFTRDPSVHLGPEVSGHGSAGDHPREEHGGPAPAADQQVTRPKRRFSRQSGSAVTLRVFLRILGNRVAELEKKFQNLETSGLWSLPGKGQHQNRCFPGVQMCFIF